MMRNTRTATTLTTTLIGALILALGLAAPAFADDADGESAAEGKSAADSKAAATDAPAWHAKVLKILLKAEKVTATLDSDDADEQATLADRLLQLDARLKTVEAEYDLSTCRFWLYEGSADDLQFSSFAQMAYALKSRADRGRKAKTRRFIEASNERVRQERERLAREAAEQQVEDHDEDQSDPQGGNAAGNRTGGKRTEGKRAGKPTTTPRGPRLVRGFLADGSETVTLVRVKLAEGLHAEFTVRFPPARDCETLPTGTAGAQAVADLRAEGKTPPLVEADEKTPEAEVLVTIISKEDNKRYPNTGKVEFRAEESETGGDDKSSDASSDDNAGSAKVEGDYRREQVFNLLIGANNQDKIQILRLKLDGVAFENVVAPSSKAEQEAEPVTLVQAKVDTTPGAIEGKALELLKTLLSVYDTASPAAAAATAQVGK